LRHEAPFVEHTARRIGLGDQKSAVQILKTAYTAHGGKLSIARVLAGDLPDGATLYGPRGDDRVAGMFSMSGQDARKVAGAKRGDTVALGRLEGAHTGDTLSAEKAGVPQIELPAS